MGFQGSKNRPSNEAQNFEKGLSSQKITREDNDSSRTLPKVQKQ
jgi:hypothetical protein